MDYNGRSDRAGDGRLSTVMGPIYGGLLFGYLEPHLGFRWPPSRTSLGFP